MSHHIPVSIILVLLALDVACAPHVPNSYVVDRTDDAEVSACTAAANDCTLRGALKAANASGGLDIITFEVSGAITLTATLPVISDDVTIDDAGHGGDIIISGNHAVQVLVVDSGKQLNLNEVTIANGSGSAFESGGIFNGGTLNVTHSTFSGNSAIEGGGIYNLGTANVTDTTFFENTVTRGGGIYNGKTLNVTNSTFVNNTASNDANGGGGGIYNYQDATLIVTNSTFFGNSGGSGGGLENERGGTATIINSTFSRNFAGESDGGGIFFVNCCEPSGGKITLYNTIVAGNGVGGDCNDPEVWTGAALSADASNFDSDGTCDHAMTKSVRELGLRVLGSNGGPTQTMALAGNSAAIDAGNDTTCGNPVGATAYGAGGKDQRGIPRPQGAHCDVGAFEAGSPISP